MKKYYLVTTEHLEDGLWFRDTEDFVAGMNYVAIQAALFPTVLIQVFILMSNHVHFVLFGRRKDVEAFINSFKRRYSQYLCCKYGVRGFLRRNHVHIKEIPTEEVEALERALAYVQMNCVAANICLYPAQYPWGTGNSFFQSDGMTVTAHKYRRLGNLSGRERVRLMHSEEALKLSDEWLISDAGYILPESYVDVDHVESLFKTPKRMQYFLRTSSKARKRLEAEDANLPAFRDQTILGALPDLLQSLFQQSSFAVLTPQEQAEALRQIQFRFSAGVHQTARVCGITYADAARLLDSV